MPSVTDQGIVGWMIDSQLPYPYYMNNARIITGSCANMDSHFADGKEKDDAWLILPGYKVKLYIKIDFGISPAGDGGVATLDNTAGDYPKMFRIVKNSTGSWNRNRTKSFEAFYKDDVRLPDMSSSTLYATAIGPNYTT